MGKVFKKVTKPIAKVLDKVVPNEIKPALPYLAAIAPFMIPGGFTIAGLSPQLSRAIATGAINLGSQAAQEGAAERGINPLSLALAAGSGYLSTPGATEGLQTTQQAAGAQLDKLSAAGADIDAISAASEAMAAPRSFLTQAQDLGITGLQKANEFMSAPLQPGGSLFSKAGLQAVAAPVGMAATEQAVLEAQRAKEEYEKQYEGWQNFTGGQLAEFNAGRRAAILASMGRAGLSQDVIDSTLATLGLRNGGRVGYKNAGIVSLTDEDSGVMYYDENEKPINKEQAMKLFNQQAEEPTREDILQAYADSDTAIKLLEKMVEEGKISQKDFNRMMRIEKDMTDIGNLDFSNYKDKKELEMAEKDIAKKEKKLSGLDDQLSKILENPVLIEKMLRENYENKANGGIIGLMGGGMPSMEMDYRSGGFIPVGSKERADDVPARLSKNEFVMTADAVRAAGGGSVNEGARRMYQLMNALEGRIV